MAITAKQALDEAIKRAGGQAALAHALGISRQVVHLWRVAPEKHAAKIERLTGVSRRDLRPDLFPPAKRSGVDLTDYWKAREALVNAIEALPPEALGLNRESRERYLSDIALPWLKAPR